MKNQSAFKKKLVAYSGMAAAMICAGESSAQIVYTDPSDIIVDGDIFDLDLNNDGVFDFRFVDSDESKTFPVIYVVGYDYSQQILEATSCYFYWHIPKPVKQGQIIKDSPRWHDIIQSSSAGIFCALNQCENYPQWDGLMGQFFGFRFKYQSGQDKYNYGWMRISVAKPCRGLKIHDWAFNSASGSSIKAGQTQRTGDDELIIGEANELIIYAFNKVLHIENNVSEEPLDIRIGNLTGQILYQTQVNSESNAIDLQSLPSGIFLVNIKANSTIHSYKVMME